MTKTAGGTHRDRRHDLLPVCARRTPRRARQAEDLAPVLRRARRPRPPATPEPDRCKPARSARATSHAPARQGTAHRLVTTPRCSPTPDSSPARRRGRWVWWSIQRDRLRELQDTLDRVIVGMAAPNGRPNGSPKSHARFRSWVPRAVHDERVLGAPGWPCVLATRPPGQHLVMCGGDTHRKILPSNRDGSMTSHSSTTRTRMSLTASSTQAKHSSTVYLARRSSSTTAGTSPARPSPRSSPTAASPAHHDRRPFPDCPRVLSLLGFGGRTLVLRAGSGGIHRRAHQPANAANTQERDP